MKLTNLRRAAFFNFRVVVATLLCLTATILTVFALVAIAHQSRNKSTTDSSRWMTRLASTLGIKSPSQRSANGKCETCAREGERASGGASALSRIPEEQPQ